ncbi:MAG: RNA polymerase sigma factor RpoD, partial [Kiloniellaceae bacterium]|nr:RNA polymerase sigma factor RpoD [Kiloniellaceae bacterium]
LCESPLTIHALLHWRQALINGEILLRDIIDLDATYGAGPDAEEIAAAEGGAPAAAANGANGAEPHGAPGAKKPAKVEGGAEAPAVAGGAEEAEADDDDENAMSLSAMEQALLPQILANLDAIADIYKRLMKVQETRLEAMTKGTKINPQTEKRYEKLKEELVQQMKSIRFNNGRIE